MAQIQTYGVFYADTRVCVGVYQATAPNYDYQSDRAVIHAVVPSYVDPTSCQLVSILGFWYAATNIESAIVNAISFGQHLMVKFAAENVALGITQLNMTNTVRTVMVLVIQDLQTGSLIDAMAQARAIPSGSKDAIFITDARLLSFINLVEDYLGMVRSSSL